MNFIITGNDELLVQYSLSAIYEEIKNTFGKIQVEVIHVTEDTLDAETMVLNRMEERGNIPPLFFLVWDMYTPEETATYFNEYALGGGILVDAIKVGEKERIDVEDAPCSVVQLWFRDLKDPDHIIDAFSKAFIGGKDGS